MVTLAIERSTERCSVALMECDRCLAERAWDESRGRGQPMFAAIESLLDDAGVRVADIDRFAVGLGPGSFSGLRVALSAARGLALPSRRDVVGVSSAEAAAWDVARASDRVSVVVVGDARRGRLWCARFVREGTSLDEVEPLALIARGELPARVRPGDLVITPDWRRIEGDLPAGVPREATLLREAAIPSARSVGELVWDRRAAGRPDRPLDPLYLHPPVFVPPRFSDPRT